MVTKMRGQLKAGTSVLVPWGLKRDVLGTIIEVWGDPPKHVRVELHFDDRDDDDERVVLLLAPSMVTATLRGQA